MSHLWDRLAEAKQRLAPVQSKYRVLFEDPSQPDAPAAVLVPDQLDGRCFGWWHFATH